MINKRAAGVWVLQQVSSVSELNSLASRLDAVLALPGVVGLSVRWPWRADEGLTIVTRAAAIAAARGKKVSGRFMAGRHTPVSVFNAGANSATTAAGVRFPLPWNKNGNVNTTFMNAYTAYSRRLADWGVANNVVLQHQSWWALDWAELNHGAEVRQAQGYTYARWLAGHKAMLDSALLIARSTGLTLEFPLSGYGTLHNGPSGDLAAHVASKMAPWGQEIFIQANGTDETREFGAPSATVEDAFRSSVWTKPLVRGLQMIQPLSYDWTQVFNRARTAKASYLEVYLPSFETGNTAALKTEALRFTDEVLGNEQNELERLRAENARLRADLDDCRSGSSGITPDFGDLY